MDGGKGLIDKSECNGKIIKNGNTSLNELRGLNNIRKMKREKGRYKDVLEVNSVIKQNNQKESGSKVWSL